MTFVNTDTSLSQAHTCGPTLDFTMLDHNQVYTNFEETMINIVFGSDGFGQQ